MNSSYPLLKTMLEIADYQRGGVVVEGEPSGDRDAMIGSAREALRQITGESCFDAVKREAERLLSIEEAI